MKTAENPEEKRLAQLINFYLISDNISFLTDRDLMFENKYLGRLSRNCP